MKNPATLLIGIVILLLFVAYMFTFQVRFNEAVYVSTFGKADRDSIITGGTEEAAGVLGNLHFKWPWPIQDVTSFDTRVQIVEDRLEQISTEDRHTIIVDAYLAWRITNPLDFNIALGDVDTARRQLQQRMRDAKSVLGEFKFDQLTNPDPQRVMLGKAEDRMLQRLRADIASQTEPWGVELISVGIKRTILPQNVTTKVFAQMQANRERLAQNARSEGESRKATIISDAKGAEQRILSFANARADAIRAQGREDAVDLYRTFADNPELAQFLRTLNTNREALGPNATIILDANTALGFDMWLPEHMRRDGPGPDHSQTPADQENPTTD